MKNKDRAMRFLFYPIKAFKKPMPLLTTNNLSYRTQNQLLLDNVSFKLYGGQKVALIGRSGSGKSVLLQALVDLLPLDLSNDKTNRIMLNNSPIQQIPPQNYRSQVTLSHQHANLTSGTVLDNLKAPFAFKYHQHKQFNQAWHLEKLIKLDKTEQFFNQHAENLSGGERQLVNFLRTLQFNPTIALFDEITSALDDETAHYLMDLVLDWHDDKKAFIWITHTPAEQLTLGADLWRMDNGRLMVLDNH